MTADSTRPAIGSTEGAHFLCDDWPRLRRAASDLTLDKLILTEAARGNCPAAPIVWRPTLPFGQEPLRLESWRGRFRSFVAAPPRDGAAPLKIGRWRRQRVPSRTQACLRRASMVDLSSQPDDCP